PPPRYDARAEPDGNDSVRACQRSRPRPRGGASDEAHTEADTHEGLRSELIPAHCAASATRRGGTGPSERPDSHRSASTAAWNSRTATTAPAMVVATARSGGSTILWV